MACTWPAATVVPRRLLYSTARVHTRIWSPLSGGQEIDPSAVEPQPRPHPRSLPLHVYFDTLSTAQGLQEAGKMIMTDHLKF